MSELKQVNNISCTTRCNLLLSGASLEALGDQRETDLHKTEQSKNSNCITSLKAHLFFVTYKFILHI